MFLKISQIILAIFLALAFALACADGADVDEALFDAVYDNDIQKIRQLLDKNANPLALQNNEKNAFWVAIEKSETPVVKLFLARKYFSDKPMISKQTPLALATDEGAFDIALLLQDRGANITFRYSNDDTLLHRAIDKQYRAQKNNLLKERELYINKLLISGVDINSVNENKISPLQLAILKQDDAIVSLLVNKKADINAQACNGTALSYAVEKREQAIIDMLLLKGANPNLGGSCNHETAVQVAAEKGDVASLEKFITQGAEFAVVDIKGNSIVHYASQSGSADVLRLVLKNGLNVNAENDAHETPLVFAARAGSLPAMKMLHDAGADLQLPKPPTAGALYFASSKGNAAIVQWMLEQGVSPEPAGADSFLNNPLAIATEHRHAEVVQLLVKAGADINRRFNSTVAPIQQAVESRDIKLVQLFIDLGADLDLKSGESPIHIANRKGHANIITLLKKAGAKRNAN